MRKKDKGEGCPEGAFPGRAQMAGSGGDVVALCAGGHYHAYRSTGQAALVAHPVQPPSAGLQKLHGHSRLRPAAPPLAAAFVAMG